MIWDFTTFYAHNKVWDKQIRHIEDLRHEEKWKYDNVVENIFSSKQIKKRKKIEKKSIDYAIFKKKSSDPKWIYSYCLRAFTFTMIITAHMSTKNSNFDTLKKLFSKANKRFVLM